MNDHLPECGYMTEQPGFGGINSGIDSTQPFIPGQPCICDRLRACEQRVLDAAWEAVGALPVFEKPYPWCGDVQHCGGDDVVELNAVIDAIDALRGER